MAVYLTAIYMDEAKRKTFEEEYLSTGKRYDVGKSCVRFRKLENLPLELIGQAVGMIEMREFVDRVKKVHSKKSS